MKKLFYGMEFQNRDSSVTLFLQNDIIVILSEAKNLIHWLRGVISLLVFIFALNIFMNASVCLSVDKELLLNSFEKEDDLARFEHSEGVRLERSTEHATDGKYSLKATFSSKVSGDDNLLIWINYPDYPINDFSTYEHLEMDVHNERETPVPGLVDFKDGDGNWRPGWIPIIAYPPSNPLYDPKKPQKAQIPLFFGMGSISEKNKFSFSDVTTIRFIIFKISTTGEKPKEDWVIYFDNIRLVTSKPYVSPDLSSSLPGYAEDEGLKDKIEVNGKTVPPLKRDIDFRVQGEHFIEQRDKSDALSSKLLSTAEERVGLSRKDELSLEILPVGLTNYGGVEGLGGYPSTWENYITTLHNLYQNKVTFVVVALNFWSGRERYERLVENIKREVKLASAIGKEYFLGVRFSESEAIPYGYVLFSEQETIEQKVDAFIAFIRRFVKDVELPEDKLLFLDVSSPIPYEWLFASGADVAGQASPIPISPIALSQSALRGMARSFNKWWEWEIVRWGLSDKPTALLPYHPKTGRPSSELKEIDSLFWQQDSRETYKMYISAYYNGAKMINAFSEDPKKGSSKEAILKFMDFVKSNPRGKDIITPIAVVKGKGRWELPQGPVVGKTRWEGEVYFKTDDDFLYLNLFFPGFSDDGTTTKYWWTGTPYGAVDIIYPEMKLGDLKRYNALLFLGRQKIDSVRKDFLNDLMAYINDGGIAVLSIEQLRNSQNKIEGEKLESFLGTEIEDSFPTPPEKRIKDYVEITEETPFKLEKKRYTVFSEEGPRVYKVSPKKEAVIVAKDKDGNPILILNNYGKGYVLLFTAPNLSTIPPGGKNPFVSDIIAKVCSYRPLPVDIYPKRQDIAFLLSKTGDKEATVFIMNHGEKDWSGEIIINMREAGFSLEVDDKVMAKVGKGYEVKEIAPKIKMDKDSIIISGITLSGDADDFCSYRQASFAYIRLLTITDRDWRKE